MGDVTEFCEDKYHSLTQFQCNFNQFQHSFNELQTHFLNQTSEFFIKTAKNTFNGLEKRQILPWL